MALARPFLVLLLSLCIFFISNNPRSVHRPKDPYMPSLTTFWTDDPHGPCYMLKNKCLREWAIFETYKPEEFKKYMIPENLSYRYEPEKSVARETLSNLLEKFIDELLQIRKRKEDDFEHFNILKDRNYNYSLRSGLMIIKFNDYPFVVKIFLENPYSFTMPFCKGFEPCWFFLMAGGINRYLAGFTRIPNLHKVQEKIETDPYWSKHVTFPRKWYWLPQNNRQFTVIGNNLGRKTMQSQNFPSIYGIICDEIALDRQLHNYFKGDRKAIRGIMDFLGNHLDPHIYNFFLEKNTGKIAIIDTELFSIMVGLFEEVEYTKNMIWYFKLANKCSKDCFFKTKKNHRDMQVSCAKPILME